MTARERRRGRRGISLLALAALLVSVAGCATTGGIDRSSATSPEPPSEAESQALGDEAARRGDFERALVHYLQGVSTQATADGWMRVGAASTRLGDRERAADAFLQVIELDPTRTDALEGAGLALMALGDDSPARNYLQQAVEHEPLRWRSHNALGILADRAEDHAAAIGHYEAALKIRPDSAVLLNNIGYSRFLSGDFAQAARDFFAATQADPTYERAWSNLALVYAQHGWYADAVRTLVNVMDKATAHNDIGYIAFQRGDLEQADLLLSEAVRLSPVYYATAYRNLDSVRAKMRGLPMPAHDLEIQGLLSRNDDAAIVGGR